MPAPAADGVHVLLEQSRIERLAGHDLADAAVHLQGSDRGDNNGRIRRKPRRAALDVEELLRAHVGPETRFRADDVAGGERQPVGDDRVVAVGDVRERAAMDEGRPALERLEEVRLDGVDEQDRHRAGDADVLAGDRPALGRRGKDDPAETRPQVVEVGGKGEDGHHLRADGDDPFRLAGDAVLAAAEADDGPPNCAIADVDHSRPEDRKRIDPERVLVVEAVVEEGRGEVVGRADRVDVAGQVEVEVLHRDHLAVAAAGGAALDPEDRPERRLADADRRLVPDPVEALGESDGRGRFALAQGRRRDRGHDDVLAAGPLGLETPDRLEGDLGLRPTVWLDLVVAESKIAGDVDDRARRDGSSDLEIGRKAHRAPRLTA